MGEIWEMMGKQNIKKSPLKYKTAKEMSLAHVDKLKKQIRKYLKY